MRGISIGLLIATGIVYITYGIIGPMINPLIGLGGLYIIVALSLIQRKGY